jgi:hypothetical protein
LSVLKKSLSPNHTTSFPIDQIKSFFYKNLTILSISLSKEKIRKETLTISLSSKFQPIPIHHDIDYSTSLCKNIKKNWT